MSKDKHSAAAVEETKAALPIATSANKVVPVGGAMADQFEEMGSAGLENVQRGKDTLIPRLTILQALSPQCTRGKAEYHPDLKPGDLYDVGMQELMPKPLLFIPIYFMTQYLEWKPGRKGLAGVHNDASILQRATVNEKNKYILPNGNTVAETAQFFGLNASADYRLSFIGMTSSQLKKARRWNTMAMDEKAVRRDGTEYTPPLFYRAYELSTVQETNDEGTWDGWKIERGPKIEDMGDAMLKVFNLAKEMYGHIKAGCAQADLSSLGNEEGVIEGNVNLPM